MPPSSLASLILPNPPSWYPGHMRQFMRNLPALLTRTDVVLELRDARLPLTSINGTFEDVLQKWRHERRALAASFASSSSSSRQTILPTESISQTNDNGSGPASTPTSLSSRRKSKPKLPSLFDRPPSTVCERIVVLNKRDLVPEWGVEPFTRAMESRFPDQRTVFASWNRPRDVKRLHEMLVNIARENAYTSTELNVLVVGMPNVGKSTLLNALRNMGIPGPTPKALRTSAHPGLTRALSTRLRLTSNADAEAGLPRVYAFDTPGVMLPFMGKGDLGAERGIKLALIAGIREGLYSEDSLASYLVYRMNLLNPTRPAYLSLLGSSTTSTPSPPEFLDLLARRLGMLKRGGERDVERAAVWFVKWWREEGCAKTGGEGEWVDGIGGGDGDGIEEEVLKGGWGFDFEWEVPKSEVDNLSAVQRSGDAIEPQPQEGGDARSVFMQRAMERVIDDYMLKVEEEKRLEGGISKTQVKKREKEEQAKKREKRVKALLERRRAGG